MNACRDHELSLSLRAAGALDAAEAARLEAHLAGCEACRAEAEAEAELLSLARLPPVSETERRALADLPARALDELRRAERRRFLLRRLSVGLALAAAAALVALAPVLIRDALRRSDLAPPPAPTAPAPPLAAWQGPDLDRLWADTALIDFESSAVAGADAADAALVAIDTASEY